MKVLVTGHDGYIGAVLVPVFQAAGHEVVGVDSHLYEGSHLGREPVPVTALHRDIRALGPDDLAGFDAVVHLAGISNDPLGDLNPDCTYDINHRGTVHVAQAAKRAGVTRFLFSSSCSLYGAHDEQYIDERAEFLPVTPYGESKLLAEQDLTRLADDDFSPTFLRNATAYGVSPRLRGDLVVNNLTGLAFTTGEALLKSDGTPWRPLVHIEDISRAFLALVEAPRERVHNEAFNVGATAENYQIRDVAEIVADVVPDSRVELSSGASPDTRNYRVDCSKLEQAFPEAAARWTVRKGVEELLAAYQSDALTFEALTGPRFQRIRRVRQLQDAGALDADLYPTDLDDHA
jgi:nucleoside-diphosphate-sugar epimerase